MKSEIADEYGCLSLDLPLGDAQVDHSVHGAVDSDSSVKSVSTELSAQHVNDDMRPPSSMHFEPVIEKSQTSGRRQRLMEVSVEVPTVAEVMELRRRNQEFVDLQRQHQQQIESVNVRKFNYAAQTIY